MKTLLRSTFACNPGDNPSLLYSNFQALRDALETGLSFEVLEDTVVWNFLTAFVDQHHHVPDFATVQGHFRYLKEDTVVDRLDTFLSMPVKTRGNFLSHLEERVGEFRVREAGTILKDAATIIESSLTVKEGKKERVLQGPADAIQYVLNRGHSIVMPSSGTRLSGDVTADGAGLQAEYERVERDPLAGVGQFAGIDQLDQSLHGAKRGELWTHAAFTGGLKSTLALNWLYNQAIYYHHSSLMFSMEMPYPQVRRLLITMHSFHEKFTDVRKALNIGRSLPYAKIRDGCLDHYTDEEFAKLTLQQKEGLVRTQDDRWFNPAQPQRRFMMDHVIRDLDDPKNEYGHLHVEVFDPDKSDFTVNDLRAKSELLFSSKDRDIRMIVVDHMGLMSPRNRHSSTTENLNEVIRDLKRLSMSFNRGMGIAVLGLFQISREGYKAAAKTDGRYNLTHLSYANEAERSSDIVTTTWVDDDLRGRSLTRFQCLKARDDQPFDVFYSGVYWPCRRIFTTHDVTASDAKKAGEEIDGLLPSE